VVQKPFGIILFIGEGLSPSRLAALRMYAANAETPLTLDGLAYTALLKNYSNDSATPDSAAAATAIATGVKVNTGQLGVDAEGNTLTNLLELARASGRTTGLITDSRLTNATAAAFYAHTGATDDRLELARTLFDSASIDIVLGGGATEFLPDWAGGARTDGRDLLTEADDAGYDLVRTRTELEDVAWWRWPKVFGVFGPAELERGDEFGPEAPQPSLSDMVRRGIELLQIHRGGYLLVVDAGLMRKAAEQNDVEGTLRAMLEFDRAIAVAQRFAGTKTTIFVCGDVGIGGLSVNGFPPRAAGRAELIGDSVADARLTWATGPAGPPSLVESRAPASGDVPTAPPQVEAAAHTVEEGSATASATLPDTTPTEQPSETVTSGGETAPTPERSSTAPAPAVSPRRPQAPAAMHAPAALNTAEDVIAFGEGLGAEALHGTIESTTLFDIIRDNL
jgi:alkaline phosphatase